MMSDYNHHLIALKASLDDAKELTREQDEKIKDLELALRSKAQTKLEPGLQALIVVLQTYVWSQLAEERKAIVAEIKSAAVKPNPNLDGTWIPTMSAENIIKLIEDRS